MRTLEGPRPSFWTGARPRTGMSRADLIILLVEGVVGCAISGFIIWFLAKANWMLLLHFMGLPH